MCPFYSLLRGYLGFSLLVLSRPQGRVTCGAQLRHKGPTRCGLLVSCGRGPVAPLPSSILGHLPTPTSPRERGDVATTPRAQGVCNSLTKSVRPHAGSQKRLPSSLASGTGTLTARGLSASPAAFLLTPGDCDSGDPTSENEDAATTRVQHSLDSVPQCPEQ